MPTKADSIRSMVKKGMSASDIADNLETTIRYVYNVTSDTRQVETGNKKSLRQDNKNYRLRQTDQRNKDRSKNYEKGAIHTLNEHQHWTETDDKLVLGGFTGTDRELSARIERSVRAIQQRRAKLKKHKTPVSAVQSRKVRKI